MIGKTLSHFRITAKLGEGGMGEVYRAEDTTLGREVAIKVLPPELAGSQERLERFQREAETLAALDHPNIVTIHTVEHAEGVHFLTMQLVEGRTLSQLISTGEMSLEEILEIAIPLAEALAAAHEKGVIHRDLKPGNVMVTEDKRVKVLDFGLAKTRPAPDEAVVTEIPTEPLTEEGRILGTMTYMSPEQLAGKDLDSRSDIFSLGVVLYEMATGKRPFGGSTSISTITAILHDTPPVVETLRPSLPPKLGSIISRCMEKDPQRRFRDASELRDELRKLQDDPGKVASSRRPMVIAGVVAVLLVATVAAIALWPRTDLEVLPTQPEAENVQSRGPSIAVLPFTNASGDSDQEYFSDGLTDDVITELSRFQELFVVARDSTFQYKGSSMDVRTLGAELGVRYLLEGSVRKAGDSIRVTAQLSDASDGRQLWAESYDRDLTASDVFQLQDELTLQVVNAIAGSYGALSRAELAQARRKPPTSLDSYDCVLRTYEYLQVHTPDNHLAARVCLERVVEVDPDYAVGLAWLAYLYGDEYHHRWNERTDEYDALDRSLELAKEAVRLDTANPVPHGALALTYFFRGDIERGKLEAGRAIDLNPNNALWLSLLGLYLVQQEDFESGLPMARKAIALNPLPPSWIGMASFYDHYHHGRYEAALTEARKFDREGDFRIPMFSAAAYGQLGRPDEAKQSLDALLSLWPRPVGDLRQELIERHALSPDLTDHLLEGLHKAGLADITDSAIDSENEDR